MLKSVFRSAIKNNLIRVNPALETKHPIMIRPKIQPPEKGDVLAILQQAPAEYQALFLLDAMTGLHRGEVLALLWRDVDWINQEIVVERAITKVRATDRAHKYIWIGRDNQKRSDPSCRDPTSGYSSPCNFAGFESRGDEQFIFQRNGTSIDPHYFPKWIALPLVKRARAAG